MFETSGGKVAGIVCIKCVLSSRKSIFIIVVINNIFIGMIIIDWGCSEKTKLNKSKWTANRIYVVAYDRYAVKGIAHIFDGEKPLIVADDVLRPKSMIIDHSLFFRRK